MKIEGGTPSFKQVIIGFYKKYLIDENKENLGFYSFIKTSDVTGIEFTLTLPRTRERSVGFT